MEALEEAGIASNEEVNTINFVFNISFPIGGALVVPFAAYFLNKFRDRKEAGFWLVWSFSGTTRDFFSCARHIDVSITAKRCIVIARGKHGCAWNGQPQQKELAARGKAIRVIWF